MALINVTERSPGHRIYQLIAWGSALALAVFLPALVDKPFRIH